MNKLLMCHSLACDNVWLSHVYTYNVHVLSINVDIICNLLDKLKWCQNKWFCGVYITPGVSGESINRQFSYEGRCNNCVLALDSSAGIELTNLLTLASKHNSCQPFPIYVIKGHEICIYMYRAGHMHGLLKRKSLLYFPSYMSDSYAYRSCFCHIYPFIDLLTVIASYLPLNDTIIAFFLSPIYPFLPFMIIFALINLVYILT